MANTRDLRFGKTFWEVCSVTTETTSAASLTNCWQSLESIQLLDLRENGDTLGPYAATNSLLRGEFSTLDILESPKDAVESSLFAILEDNPLPKYFLKPKTCAYFLKKAEKKGTVMHPILKQALIAQAGDAYSASAETVKDLPLMAKVG